MYFVENLELRFRHVRLNVESKSRAVIIPIKEIGVKGVRKRYHILKRT